MSRNVRSGDPGGEETVAGHTPTWLHRYATALACLVLLLISAGALVTSREAGLSVPDWPLSYGSLNPPRWWQIANVRAEHGHRLIAGTVALLTVGLAVSMARREPRVWLRRLSYGAVAAVLTQALLGGLTVLYFLPTPISVSHAGLAQIFFCLCVTMAVTTSSWWRRPPRLDRRARPVFQAAAAATGLVYVQILLGAVMRHSGAGLAIPDFPLAFGRLIPPSFDFPIAIHFAHRIGAVVVTAAIAVCVYRVARSGIVVPVVRLPGYALGVLVVAQITLGATVVLTGKAVVPNTAHVATGAAILATCLILALAAGRLGREPAASAASLPEALGQEAAS